MNSQAQFSIPRSLEKDTILVQFKKSDFKKADFWNIYDCPIYRAVNRELGHPEGLVVGGRTVKTNYERFVIGEVRINYSEHNPQGSLMNPKGLGTLTLAHIHQAIRYKHFKNATITLIKLS